MMDDRREDLNILKKTNFVKRYALCV